MEKPGASGMTKRKDSEPANSPVLLKRPDQTLRLEQEALEQLKALVSKQLIGSLVVIAGTPADVGNHLVVNEAVVIGRDQTDMPLRDGRISRRHAIVERRNNSYLVRDLGSTNGTLVNEQRLNEERQLVNGDRISVGQTVIKFTLIDHTEALYLSRMEKLVGTDELTGLQSKHRFDAALQEAIDYARLTQQALAVLMMDMDGLKQINDTYGHHAGANAIREVGILIATVLRGRGEACRFGGDEFSAFVPGAHAEAALQIAEEIRQAVERMEFVLEAIHYRAQISIGVAERPSEIHQAKPLLDLADQALYRAKRKGRNTVSD
jgi:diguanylate cyclase (GGDEF)-like protein